MASLRKKPVATFEEHLRKNSVRGLTDGRSYARGERYFSDGSVKSLTQYGQRLSATVQGTFPYKTSLWMKNDKLRSSCSCPADGFCKHRVAVALAFLAGKAEVLDNDGDTPPVDGVKNPKKNVKNKSRAPDLRTHLMAQSKERLAGWLLELAAKDGALLERLKLDAATANPDGVDMDDFRRRIDRGLDFPDVPYDYDHYGYGEGGGEDSAMARFEPVMEALEKIFSQGHAAPVASLVEYALARFEKVAHRLEHDPDAADDIIERLCALHIRAIGAAAPDPVALAEWIFNRSLATASTYGDFPWERYRRLMGAVGTAHFRKRVEAAWDQLPAKTTKDHSYETSGGSRLLTKLMVAFTEADDDVDARAAVACKDLSSPHRYLELAEIYRKAKRFDEALNWAEKGWAAFPEPYQRHEGLRALLATEYRRRKRVGDAMALYWNEYARAPGLRTYTAIKKEADLDRAWPTWREKAIASLRADIEAKRRAAEKRKATRAGALWGCENDDRSRLVEIFLWERKPEAAWKEAVEGGCSEELWLKLAKGREKKHPADGIPIWRRRVERLTRNADQSDYAPAAESLKKLGELMKRTGQAKAFVELMAEIRLTRKARRNFIAELDRRRLP